MVHVYQNNGFNIALDVNSGAVHVVDDVVYDLIPELEECVKAKSDKEKISEVAFNVLSDKDRHYPTEDVIEAIDEIIELYRAELLYTDDVYEPYIEQFGKRETVVKALCLHIAHDCNLACKYCFAEEGEYHGRRAIMSYEVGKKALDFLVQNSGNRVNLEVDFFGGEPLMNWQVVKDLVRYGRSLEEPYHKKFRFTLTTNGVLLNDEILDFVNQEMGNIVLSIDGRKEIHDLMRPHRGGQGSYDEVVPKYIKVAESRNQMNYYVRGTFTHNNLDFSKDVMHLADLGFKQDFNFFHFMIDMEGGPCVYKRLSGCGSGTEYLAVTPWGDFYPCHQFVGMEEFLMGNVDDGIVRPDIMQEFKDCNVYAKEKCKNCFAKFYCSGGCAANAYNFGNSIYDAYDIGCELQRKRIECAIMIKAAMAAGEENEV